MERVPLMKENINANKANGLYQITHFLGNTDAPMCPLTSSPHPDPVQLPWYFPSYASASEVNLSNFLHRSYLFKC